MASPGKWSGRMLAAVAGWLPAWAMRAYIKRLLVTWQHPENALFDDGAVLVNQLGRRFTNERLTPRREIDVARQPGKVAYIVLDGRLIQRYSSWPHFISTAPDIAYAYTRDYRRLRPDVTSYAPTLAALAGARSIDAAELSATLDQFNRYTAGETPDPLGRVGDAQPLGPGPWMLLGPVKAYFTTTEGGARIDRRLRVLDARGEPIPGLFAVGQNGLGGMVLWGHGLHIAWALTSGRLCGKSVMVGTT
jgi:succinate dehydrogenase/fumarate reductase flavoprotein subunit